MLTAVAQNRYAFRDASEALRNDREVVLAAVKDNWLALRYASQALRNDRALVLAAVVECGLALQYASEALRNDRALVLTAVSNNRRALQFVAEPLWFIAAMVAEWRRMRLLFIGQRDPNSWLSWLPIEIVTGLCIRVLSDGGGSAGL